MDIDPLQLTAVLNPHEDSALGHIGLQGHEWSLTEDAPELLARARAMCAYWLSVEGASQHDHPRSAALFAISVAHAMDTVMYLQSQGEPVTVENIRHTKLVGLDKNSVLSRAG